MHLADCSELPPADEAIKGHEHPGHAFFAGPLDFLDFVVCEHDPLVEDDPEDAAHQLRHVLLDQSGLLLVLSLQCGC